MLSQYFKMNSFKTSRLCGQPSCIYCRYCRVFMLIVFLLLIIHVNCDQHQDTDHSTAGDTANSMLRFYYEAEIKYTYKKGHDQVTKSYKGKFGVNREPSNSSISGKVVQIFSYSNSKRGGTKVDRLGCGKYAMKLPSVKWIALVERGECNFTEKISRATVLHNASAIIIYDNETAKKEDLMMRHKDLGKNVAVLILKEAGQELAGLLKSGVDIDLTILRHGRQYVRSEKDDNKENSSVPFLSVSFSIVFIIAVSWFMYYYIRKFRYSHAKERLAKRLARAAKKAIAKIPQRTLSVGDKELERDFDQCAVCIEPYKDGDIIRLMPCRHIFHKSCVDPWLMDHRTCPMCKLDILQAFGMSMGKPDMLANGMEGSQELTHRNIDAEAVLLESTHSVDGRVRSESGALVLDDHEPSSSLEDEIQESAEVKVVLVPHTCLHYHRHDVADKTEVLEEDEEEDAEPEPSTSLLAAHNAYSTGTACGSADSVNSSSTGKDYRGKMKAQNRTVGFKTDGESSVGTEALIHPPTDLGSDADRSSTYATSDPEAGDKKPQLKEKEADPNLASKYTV